MEIAPFKIKQLRLDSSRLRVNTKPVDKCSATDEFPAYLVISTAPHNIDEEMPALPSLAETKEGLTAIATDLHRIQSDPTIHEAPELVIAVHGYNTEEKGIRAWYSDIYRYIAQDDKHIRHKRNLVFVGYRWSSERVSARPLHLWRNLRALPDVPQALLAIGLVFMLSYWGWSFLWEPLWNNQWTKLLGATVLSKAVAVSVIILTLLLLRITVYFRDVYRAINFAVPDLTELVRQIDQAVIDLRVEDLRSHYPDYGDAMRQAKRIAQEEAMAEDTQKIKLNFLGHSMGGLVITNVVRILSDVFDRRSIAQNPVSDIGNTLSLGRLILASPDIPVLSIISSRANGLASSLRRFEEAYLFSNEGDLALRLASTAANYISFPSAKQNHGHRLGSVALTNNMAETGIVNLASLRENYPMSCPLGEAIAQGGIDILQCLYITHSSGKGDGYLSLGELFAREHVQTRRASLADLFTFFDCTDYKDYRLLLDANGRRTQSKCEVGLLTLAKRRKHLNLLDYIEIIFNCLCGRLDVHGGYFHGEYSRELMYRLAFIGFEEMLQAVAQNSQADYWPEYQPEESLNLFDQQCANKGIQVYLSPLRYRVNVQGANIHTAKDEMMQTIQPESLARQVQAHVTSESSAQSVPLAG
ncbi:MAG: alpha/beta hydrolase [Cyanobacteria bacterium P01_F01_bin.3]